MRKRLTKRRIPPILSRRTCLYRDMTCERSGEAVGDMVWLKHEKLKESHDDIISARCSGLWLGRENVLNFLFI